jgi:hypothetical protein
MTREIAQKDWPAFCLLISEKYRDALVNIQLINTHIEQLAPDSPLQRFVLDSRTDACSSHLIIEAGSLQHELVDPIRFILRKPAGQPGSERYHALEIPAENGTTVVTFHPGIASEDLNEI